MRFPSGDHTGLLRIPRNPVIFGALLRQTVSRALNRIQCDESLEPPRARSNLPSGDQALGASAAAGAPKLLIVPPAVATIRVPMVPSFRPTSNTPGFDDHAFVEPEISFRTP